MIIYNVRNMGAYLSDVLRLNIFQLFNKTRDAEIEFSSHAIHDQLKELDVMIKKLTQCDDGITLTERLLLLEKSRENK